MPQFQHLYNGFYIYEYIIFILLSTCFMLLHMYTSSCTCVLHVSFYIHPPAPLSPAVDDGIDFKLFTLHTPPAALPVIDQDLRYLGEYLVGERPDWGLVVAVLGASGVSEFWMELCYGSWADCV